MTKKKLKIKKGVGILIFVFVVFVSVILSLLIIFKFYMISMKDNIIDLNLKSLKSGISSKVYFLDSDQEFKEYSEVSGNFKRIWVDFQKIPQHMKDAIICMEDKRFYKHGGVDFFRTFGATVKALMGKKDYGGSTITQQLVKNLTNDSKVTVDRKIREMGRAFKLENKMSKDEILECYLNIVNFGSGTSGVQAAANVYFNKNIENCSIAECASIAVITKNPTKYNPFNNQEGNKRRRNVTIKEMFKQKKISKSQCEQALKDSDNLKFHKGTSNTSENRKSSVRNWYLETLCSDVVSDLSEKYGIKKELASEMLYSGGLKIYSCVNPNAQKIADSTIRSSIIPKDKDLELAFIMMDYEGKILSILGSAKPKIANLVYNRAVAAKRQPGSTMKPISVYAPAIDYGIFHYSSKIPDAPLEIDFNGSGRVQRWPVNWYKSYKGEVTLQWAIEKSANAPVAQVLHKLGLDKSFNFLTQKLNFKNLDLSDSVSYASLAMGGTHVGVTVREMINAYQIFGNGGKFFNSTTYYYVTDKDGNILLDNRNREYKQVISSSTSYIMNRLLRQVVIGGEGTGKRANIENYEIVGKTGTSSKDLDSWFAGLSPSCLGVIWVGYDKPKTIKDKSVTINIWKRIFSEYLKTADFPHEFSKTDDVMMSPYCATTGLLANEECPDKRIGYYCNTNVPPYCDQHGGQKCEIKETKTDIQTPDRNDTKTNIEETLENIDNTSNNESQ